MPCSVHNCSFFFHASTNSLALFAIADQPFLGHDQLRHIPAMIWFVAKEATCIALLEGSGVEQTLKAWLRVVHGYGFCMVGQGCARAMRPSRLVGVVVVIVEGSRTETIDESRILEQSSSSGTRHLVH